jgi:hypothetical protein
MTIRELSTKDEVATFFKANASVLAAIDLTHTTQKIAPLALNLAERLANHLKLDGDGTERNMFIGMVSFTITKLQKESTTVRADFIRAVIANKNKILNTFTAIATHVPVLVDKV